MIVQILGKEHRQGKSKKTGRDYDFSIIHFASKARYVDGLAAVQKVVGSDIITYDKILINLHYDIETDLDGNIIGMNPAKV